jgi:transposase
MTKDGKRRKIHLYHQPRTTKKEGLVSYYSLAVCYKENGKNMKKVLQYLGRLSDIEANNYKSLLHALNCNQSASQLVDINSIILKEEKKYFNCLIVNELWKQLNLSDIFNTNIRSNQSLSTEQIARILTINRLLDPASKIGTINWLDTTLLPSIMQIDKNHYTKNKIFNELAKIHKNKSKIEQLFWKFSKQNSSSEFEVYYFDGSTSWFEGTKCSLSKYALEKTRNFYSHVIGLMLITDRKGYPVAWEAVEGNKKDSSEFKPLIERVREKYKIKKITYCFDRGVASISNFENIEKCDSKFISGIRDNQIPKIFDLNKFKKTRERILNYCNLTKEEQKGMIPIGGFYTSNKKVFYRDLGTIEKMRYIVSFNVQIYAIETADRETRIHKTALAINALNLCFKNRSKTLKYDEAEKQLLEVFKKHRTSQFCSYSLIPTLLNKKFESYKVELTILNDNIESAKLTDGMMVYITDHTEKKNKTIFKLSAFDIIKHYRNKYIIENSFRELKSFLDLRPFYVRTEEHVKAHYDIGVIACFINNYIYEQLSMPDRNFIGLINLIQKQFPEDIKNLKEYSKEKNKPLKEITKNDDIFNFILNASKTKKMSNNFIKTLEHYCYSTSVRDFYSEIKASSTVMKLLTPNGLEIYKMKPLSSVVQGYLNQLNMASLASPSAHTSIKIYQ